MKTDSTRSIAKKTVSPSALSSVSYKNLEKYAAICQYYGFSRLPAISVSKEALALAQKIGTEPHVPDIFTALHTEEQIAVLLAFQNKELGKAEPAMTFYESRLPHAGVRQSETDTSITLDVIGSKSALVEVGLIHLAFAILNLEHTGTYNLEINSIGDKDSIGKFNKELSSYYKKHAHTISASLKKILTKTPLLGLLSTDAALQSIREHAPQTIHTLSEQSSAHFKEFLTHLGKIDICYEINPQLIPNRQSSGETSFVIRPTKESVTAPYAVTTRYHTLAKKIGIKQEIPAIRMTIVLPKAKLVKVKPTKTKEKKPLFYIIQLGVDAKLKSLDLLERLRKAKIPVKYGMIKDKLVGQLSQAENLETPYALIIGQRESLENTVLVRHMIDQSQETVDIANIVEYLKKIKK